MSQSSGEQAAEFYAQTYDDSVPDWPGEMEFYREMAADATSAGGSVLEIACGMGRVAIRLHCIFRFEMEHLLARAGFAVDAVYGDFFRRPLGEDSTHMIWVARPAGSLGAAAGAGTASQMV
jgi:hypothetical protein